MDRKWILALVCVLAWSPLSVRAASPAELASDKAQSPSTSYFERVAHALADNPQLRDRALAAQLLGFDAHAVKLIGEGAATATAPATSEALPARAATNLLPELAGSDDPLALSIALQHGQSIGDKAQVQAAARRWHALEPDNLAPLLWLEAPVAETLASARHARRYDSHAYAQIRFMIQAFERTPMNAGEVAALQDGHLYGDEARAAVTAFAIWAAYGIPAFQDLASTCRGDALQAATTRAGDCRHMGQVMATTADVGIAQSIGIGMLARAASSPAETAEAVGLRRTYDWQLQQRYGDQLDDRQLSEDLATMLRLLRDPGIRTEMQMSQAMLRERGVALTPPTDWQPPSRN